MSIFGRLPNVFGRLPKAIQNEIYEFARGDRKYWRGQFKKCEGLLNKYKYAIELSDESLNAQPTGTVNFSRIDNARLTFEWSPETVELLQFSANMRMFGGGRLKYKD
mgnify:CR=1 FL=1